MRMDLNETPQQITIKVPFSEEGKDNFTTSVPLSWSVQRLKQHLECEAPNKPKAEGQKLILAGRILQDDQLLKDCLKKVHGSLPVLHLVHSRPVLTPVEAEAKRAESEGVRRRQAAESTPTSEPSPSADSPSQYNGQNDYAQMMQNYQEYYHNYMMGWSQMMQSGGWPYPAQTPVMPPTNYPFSTGIMAPTPIAHVHPHRHNHFAVLHLNGPQLPANPVPLNAPAAVEEQAALGVQRDLIDWMHIFTRITLLICVIYFYSSTSRFFSAFTMLTLILLFHTVRDFRRWRERHLRQQQQQATPEPTPLNEERNQNGEEAPVERPPPEQQGLISTVVSIVVGFITSLVPDNVAHVVAN